MHPCTTEDAMSECAPTTAAPQGTCSHLKSCPMFQAFGAESTGKIFRKIYCEGKYTECARYQRSGLGQSVPDTLLPNGTLMKAV
jgi:hypothetical protein